MLACVVWCGVYVVCFARLIRLAWVSKTVLYGVWGLLGLFVCTFNEPCFSLSLSLSLSLF